MADEKNKYADQTVDKKTVDGMTVKTWTLNDKSDSLFRIYSEEELAQKEREYEQKMIEEAEKRFRERERRMYGQMEQDLAAELQEEMEEAGFETTTIGSEDFMGKLRLDPDQVQEALSRIKKDDRIICIGDSLVYGFDVEGSLTWIGTLRREEHINLLNAGINGDTTENMFERFYEHVVQLEAKAVVILGGGNDVFGTTPLEYVTSNYAMMVQMAMNYGIVPIVATPTEPDHKKVPKEWKQFIDYDESCRKIQEYNRWLREFARVNKLPIIDFDKEMHGRLKAGYGRFFIDGAHPNPAGHRMMAAIAKDAFIKMGILEKKEKPVDHRFDL